MSNDAGADVALVVRDDWRTDDDDMMTGQSVMGMLQCTTWQGEWILVRIIAFFRNIIALLS